MARLVGRVAERDADWLVRSAGQCACPLEVFHFDGGCKEVESKRCEVRTSVFGFASGGRLLRCRLWEKATTLTMVLDTSPQR